MRFSAEVGRTVGAWEQGEERGLGVIGGGGMKSMWGRSFGGEKLEAVMGNKERSRGTGWQLSEWPVLGE